MAGNFRIKFIFESIFIFNYDYCLFNGLQWVDSCSNAFIHLDESCSLNFTGCANTRFTIKSNIIWWPWQWLLRFVGIFSSGELCSAEMIHWKRASSANQSRANRWILSACNLSRERLMAKTKRAWAANSLIFISILELNEWATVSIQN